MTGQVVVERADGPGVAEELAELCTDCVEGGASVGFMLPVEKESMERFWRAVVDSAARGERALLVARFGVDAPISGTVQVVFATPENQPHRGEVTKMLVHRNARRRGLGEALMRAAEAEAAARGKTLLVLDTANPEAERLYTRLGWTVVGRIPDYALGPEGGLVDTVVYFKRIGAQDR